ncbi:hypothetical protein POM88_023083 [Heracleum sosnowskyi]|uniref:Uncharacterized protein n=1 Tax=Heracleum sosnowskyi TaxID=360622 RepID=A0AAD8IIT5_9APIA|nr:hypothetical protein POM88_023083 [Heracleum sosnowskyi]
MDGVVVDESKKRRLPSWMLGVSGADQVKKSRKEGSNDVDKIGKEENVLVCKAKKARARRAVKCDNEVGDRCEDVEDNVVVKRQRVTRKKKDVRKDVVSASSDAEEVVMEEKSKRNVGRKAVQKSVIMRSEKRKSKGFGSREDIEVESKGLESSEDIEAASPNEDDEDLNMDDLISIANEFVKDEKKSKRNVGRKVVQKTVSRGKEKRKSKGFEGSEDIECESKNVESSEDIEAASPNEGDEDLTMDDLLNFANEFVKDEKDGGQQKKSDAEQTVHKQCAPTAISRNEPAHSVIASEAVKRLPHEETASCHNVSSTGDPAQDMLDLLLGPLLTQPPKEEKKADIITDEMVIAHQLKKQNQKVHINDAAIPLAKKKTSLKDKVAMFLD